MVRAGAGGTIRAFASSYCYTFKAAIRAKLLSRAKDQIITHHYFGCTSTLELKRYSKVACANSVNQNRCNRPSSIFVSLFPCVRSISRASTAPSILQFQLKLRSLNFSTNSNQSLSSQSKEEIEEKYNQIYQSIIILTMEQIKDEQRGGALTRDSYDDKQKILKGAGKGHNTNGHHDGRFKGPGRGGRGNGGGRGRNTGRGYEKKSERGNGGKKSAIKNTNDDKSNSASSVEANQANRNEYGAHTTAGSNAKGNGGGRQNMSPQQKQQKRGNFHRGNHHQTNHRSQQKRSNHTASAARASPPLNIETNNFQSHFHNRLCRAAKYKVHAPNCSCSKVMKLRERYRNQFNQQQSHSEEDISHQLRDMSISSNAGSISFHSSHKSSTTNDISNNDSNHAKIKHNDDPFNNLIVVPDTKFTPAIYVCQGTNIDEFQKGGSACERNLANEIFSSFDSNHDAACGGGSGDNIASVENSSEIAQPFKVNCALCLLSSFHPNGFVAIASKSLAEVNRTILCARDAMHAKLQGGDNGGGSGQLHADHAHFICAIDEASLQSLLLSGKTRKRSHQVSMEILSQMKDGGVELPSEIFASKDVELQTVSNLASSSTPTVLITMGHHLTSLLWLLQKQSTKSPPSTKSFHEKQSPPTSTIKCKEFNHPQYLMVMGYKDGPYEWNLDLPGGKRHLGETTLEGLIREVEEECSLQLDKDWLAKRVSFRYGGIMMDDCNITVGGAKNGDDGYFEGVQVLDSSEGKDSGNVYVVMTPPQL